MAYDGKIMRRAILRFEEDRQAREARFQARRRGTDPLPAVERLREENLGLQAERRQLLEQMGLAETALEEVPECPLCGDTGYCQGRVCRCLERYYTQEQQKELSRMLDLGLSLIHI